MNRSSKKLEHLQRPSISIPDEKKQPLVKQKKYRYSFHSSVPTGLHNICLLQHMHLTRRGKKVSEYQNPQIYFNSRFHKAKF
jgi:hypothetical protein